MKISATTIKMAERRNMAFVVETDGFIIDPRGNARKAVTLEISRFVDDVEDHWDASDKACDEYAALYEIKPNGLFFAGSCERNTEFPHWIEDEKHLRSLLNDMAASMGV